MTALAPSDPAAVSTHAKRPLASGQWLLASAPLRPQTKAEWEQAGAAWMRPGALFAAVLIPAGVIHAAVGLDDPEACAAPLAEVLEYGPLFYSPEGFGTEGSYTALLPARIAQLPPIPGAVTHPQTALLLVPAPNVTARADDGPWWVSPLDGPGLLCALDRVAALAGLGRDVLSTSEGRHDA